MRRAFISMVVFVSGIISLSPAQNRTRLAFPRTVLPVRSTSGLPAPTATGVSMHNASAVFTVGIVNAGPSMTAAVDGSAENLKSGTTYTMNPGPYVSAISPTLTGMERYAPVSVEINGGGTESTVEISFKLPGHLTTESGERIACSLPHNGLYWENHNEWLDPNGPVSVLLDEGERANFQVGLSISLPAEMGSSEFRGDITIQENILGM